MGVVRSSLRQQQRAKPPKRKLRAFTCGLAEADGPSQQLLCGCEVARGLGREGLRDDEVRALLLHADPFAVLRNRRASGVCRVAEGDAAPAAGGRRVLRVLR